MKSPNHTRLYIREVSARDGFQFENKFVPTAQKIDYINRLSRTGIAKIEVTSFVSPRAIPTLADAESVMEGITRASEVEYSALVPNLRGCDRALSSKVDEINLVMSVSEGHNRANLRMSCDASLAQLSEIVMRARDKVNISVSLSTAFGCPYDGRVASSRVLHFINRFAQIGVERISLCDTTGMANPMQVQQLFLECRGAWPSVQFAAHFHNTRGMGLANVVAAREAEVAHFDSSLGGLGGCPFAVGATGNVCTEDLVHMLEAMGYQTAVDLEALLLIAADLPLIVGHDVPSQVLKAGPSSRVYTHGGESDQDTIAREAPRAACRIPFRVGW